MIRALLRFILLVVVCYLLYKFLSTWHGGKYWHWIVNEARGAYSALRYWMHIAIGFLRK